MVPMDNRKTNFTVEQTLLVKHKVVANEIDVNTIRVGSKNIDTSNLNVNSIETKELKVTEGNATNVLFTLDPASVISGSFPEFSTNERTVVHSTSIVSGDSSDYFFLNGSDGNVTITTPTIFTRDMYFDTLTVEVGGVINPGGWVTYCKTALINNGSFRVNGDRGFTAVGATGGIGGTVSITTGGPIIPGTSGAAGGNQNVNGTNSSTIRNAIALGGVGGNSDTKTGGTVSDTIRFLNPNTMVKSVAFFPELHLSVNSGLGTYGLTPGVGGAGGAGGSLGGGAGGGGGGGSIYIVAKNISGTGTFEAMGGNGGNGGNTSAGGGGGGAGGFVYFLTQSSSITSQQVFLSGGTGGTGGTVGGFVGLPGNTGRFQVNLV